MDSSLENKLNYRVIGKGHPVVFLHGFMLSNTMWKSLYEKIPDGVQAIFIDLPGHGKSKNIECSDTLSGIANQVQQMINSIITEPYCIVGHSLGGYVALDILAKGANIKKCILLNSNFWEDSGEKKKERNRICKVVQLNSRYLIQEAIPHLFPPIHQDKHEAVIQQLVDGALQMQPENIIHATIAMRDRHDLSSIVAKNQSKFFIIQGLLDHIIPTELMDYYLEKRKINQALIHRNNSGHMSIIERPDEISSLIFEFLS